MIKKLNLDIAQSIWKKIISIWSFYDISFDFVFSSSEPRLIIFSMEQLSAFMPAI